MVNRDVAVGFPGLKGATSVCSNELVAFDAAPSGVVADDDESASKVDICEPYLVFWQVPVGIMGPVESFEAPTWCWSPDLDTRDVFLNQSLPEVIGAGTGVEGA